MAKDEGKPKKVERINRKDLKILRHLMRRERTLRRNYQRWQERQCDELGIFRSWVNWTDGQVVNRDDPAKPKPLDPLPKDVREKARKREDEILDAHEKFEEYIAKLADLHNCVPTDIALSTTGPDGRPTGKMLGEIDRGGEVEELEALEGGEEYLKDT